MLLLNQTDKLLDLFQFIQQFLSSPVFVRLLPFTTAHLMYFPLFCSYEPKQGKVFIRRDYLIQQHCNILLSSRRLRAKYTPRTNLQFVLRVFRLDREARTAAILKRKASEKNSGRFSGRANKNTLGKNPLTKSGNLDRDLLSAALTYAKRIPCLDRKQYKLLQFSKKASLPQTLIR